MAQGEWPTLREELERKTFDTVEWLFDHVRAGLLSQQQFSTGIDAVWSTVSGLIGDSLLEIVSAAEDVVAEKTALRQRVLTKAGSVAVLKWTVGESQVIYRTIGAFGRKDKQIDTDTPIKACQLLDLIASKLLASGWEEL